MRDSAASMEKGSPLEPLPKVPLLGGSILVKGEEVTRRLDSMPARLFLGERPEGGRGRLLLPSGVGPRLGGFADRTSETGADGAGFNTKCEGLEGFKQKPVEAFTLLGEDLRSGSIFSRSSSGCSSCERGRFSGEACVIW